MDVDRLHVWLLAHNGDTFAQLRDDIAALKGISPKSYEDLPTGEAWLGAGLYVLESRGLARREGTGDNERWWYVAAAEKPAAKMLF